MSVGRTDRSTYRPWDREEKLGEPPWKPDDPKVIAWEQAHGHDVRLKCYPEFGCQVLHSEEEYEQLSEAARAVVDALACYESTLTWVYRREQIPLLLDACRELRKVLDA